ncbi:hypothetical protein V5799_027470 [Amblyomma americanum]|uniref:Peptidase M13 N-terminal domain-containing protein n=1 Tax=Amblyomma americanum TaxID=6943 RepID=A0AAQ4DFM3_AMBAM
MPEIVGRLYVQHKFSREAKQEVEDLARRITAVFNERLQTAKWMDKQTRNVAENKTSFSASTAAVSKLFLRANTALDTA